MNPSKGVHSQYWGLGFHEPADSETEENTLFEAVKEEQQSSIADCEGSFSNSIKLIEK